MVPIPLNGEYGHLPRSPKEAKHAGLTLYFTGNPCPKGHVVPRKAASMSCLECARAVSAAYNHTPRGRDSALKAIKSYRATPKGRANARSTKARRRASKLRATPPWSERAQITEFYKDCPKGFDVDHIIPLRHKNICGLHVMLNLQYLPAQKNRSKSNRLVGDGLEYAVCPIPTSGTIV